MFRARWQDGVLRPMTNSPPDLDDGEIVFVEVERGRSPSSHKHQFAWIKDAWNSIPERLMFEEWAATPETLRKRALIECGFYEQIIIDCADAKTAKEVARELGKAHRAAHGYAVAAVRGSVAVVRFPQSQSMRSMGGERFKQSKAAILDWIADKIGVAPEDLARAAA